MLSTCSDPSHVMSMTPYKLSYHNYYQQHRCMYGIVGLKLPVDTL